MVNATIDGVKVRVANGTTIKQAAESVGISIPSLCYLKDLNEIGACRVCCVEVEGEQRMVPSCNNPVQEGMVIHTNSPRARETRRTNVELILSQHDCHCATCVRSGNCKLQTLSNDLGILTTPYEEDLPRGVKSLWTTTFPLYRDAKKCIKCMRCVQICDKEHLGADQFGQPLHHRRFAQPPHQGRRLRAVRPVHHPLSGGRAA